MQIENLIQGTAEWHQFRLDHCGASEAAAMLGISTKMQRNDLLKMKHTGIAKEFSDWVENVLFADGHEAETKARPLAAEIVGNALYPVTYANGYLSVSCDGLTFDEKTAFEHKQWNKRLAQEIEENNTIPDEHMAQCQQALLVTGAKRILFMTSDGTYKNMAHIYIYPDQKWFARLLAGWQRFKLDLKEYTPPVIEEKPEPDAILQLPALVVQIKGEVTTSNLPEFQQAAETFISNIKTELTTDEDFVNAENTVKFCNDTEKKIEFAKSAAIAQTASIDELLRSMDHIKEMLRAKRLKLDKLVSTQKENIKTAIINDAYKSARAYASDLASEIKLVDFSLYVEPLLDRRSFHGVTKNKRTLASLHNAIDTHVSQIKTALDCTAKTVRKNIALLLDTEQQDLIPDIQQIAIKPFDDFKLLVESRINAHKNRVKQQAQEEIEAAQQRTNAAPISEPAPQAKPALKIVSNAATPTNETPLETEIAGILNEACTALCDKFSYLNRKQAFEICVLIWRGKIKHLKVIE